MWFQIYSWGPGKEGTEACACAPVQISGKRKDGRPKSSCILSFRPKQTRPLHHPAFQKILQRVHRQYHNHHPQMTLVLPKRMPC